MITIKASPRGVFPNNLTKRSKYTFHGIKFKTMIERYLRRFFTKRKMDVYYAGDGVYHLHIYDSLDSSLIEILKRRFGHKNIE